MTLKRKLSSLAAPAADRHDSSSSSSSKRSQTSCASSSPTARPPTRDIISTLSDELLVRILSPLSETALLAVAPVSRRFRRLAADSQLWRAHYYTRFVLPRALRIPGFRLGAAAASSGSDGPPAPKLQCSARRAVRADGGWGTRRGGGPLDVQDQKTPGESVDWKKLYKLRHNWARGKCAVDEVSVRDASEGDPAGRNRTLVKVVAGIAVTADSASGLRAWDLRTRQPIAQADLLRRRRGDCSSSVNDEDVGPAPSSLAVDEQGHAGDVVDIAVGFADGGFGVWRLDVGLRRLTTRHRREKSAGGEELVAMAYGHPYVLTATSAGVVSLYTFNRPPPVQLDETDRLGEMDHDKSHGTDGQDTDLLPPPHLLTSLTSPTTRQPLALSIRRMTTFVSASIAYAFSSLTGWCIGVQDIHIQPSTSGVVTLSSRLAYTLPINVGGRQTSSTSASTSASTRSSSSSPPSPPSESQPCPTTLCYNHPYLLATLPDNTLILHLCTSTASSLSLSSPGIRLWGHTSGISDAEITPRGKAVSISTRGDEMRVWELEGRAGGSSIEVRPRQPADDADRFGHDEESLGAQVGNDIGPGDSPRAPRLDIPEWEDRRNWVGFDDEMVIVLKEARDGRESLMVYDFT